jgi:cellulose synthase operon protein C
LRQAVITAAPRMFRTARKCGLAAEAEALMLILDPARGEWEGTGAVPPERIGLAVGWFAAGDTEAGTRILDAARASLFPTAADDPAGRTPVPDDPRARTPVALAYAEALGFAPARIALGRLEEIFQRLGRVSVDGSTNRYFTLHPLRLVDTVVRSVVTDEFTLGATVRAWLDEDEFLIRRRIHREMAGLLREQDGA